MERQTITFTKERDTKNTVRYQEDFSEQPPIVGTIYLQKWALGQNPLEKLSITIEETKYAGIRV